MSVAPIISSPLEIKPKMTMSEILLLMQAADEGMAALSIEEMEDLADRLEDKVDGYQHYIDKCEWEAKRLDMRIKDFTATKKTLLNRGSNLKKLLAIHMQKHSFKFLRGNDHKASLTVSKKVKVTPKATSALYLEYSDFMTLSYKWDKKKIGAALKKGNEIALRIAEIKKTYGCKFAPNKGAVDD